MGKKRIGVIGTSDIAFRRFLPALMKSKDFKYVGVASRNYERTKRFIELYGGRGYGNYSDLIESEDVEVLYLPLPPALHYEFAKKSLECGKHVLIEKPFTTKLSHTKDLLELARIKNLTINENYGFIYHSQLEYINRLLQEEHIGKINLCRIAFGYPLRQADDFRYNKELGGGALLDCGGYPLKLAMLLLGNTARVTTAKLNYDTRYEVDLFGSATLENDQGLVAQISFGMDNAYKCEFEAWCSKGTLLATRIFTAGDEFNPELILKYSNYEKKILLPADDQFLKTINILAKCMRSSEMRERSHQEIISQGKAIEMIRQIGGEEWK